MTSCPHILNEEGKENESRSQAEIEGGAVIKSCTVSWYIFPKGGWIKFSWTILILPLAIFWVVGCVFVSFIYIWKYTLKKFNFETT